MVQFSEETKERISKVIEVSRIAIHYLSRYELSNKPTIIIISVANNSTGYTYSEPKPTLFKYFAPVDPDLNFMYIH
uniref:Mitochondrial import receptor subunit tom7 n=1 Tax=Talaromyces marneffei PM1 TaxID=1077442 RepID=A0A093X9N5_TALMA